MGAALTTALAGRTAVNINLEGKKALDLASTLDELKIRSGIDWTFGTGVNQANLLFHDSRTTDDTGETHDIYAGALVNAFGDSVTMEAIKLLYVMNTHATLTLEIFGGASVDVPVLADPSDIFELPPGGIFLWTCPTAAGIVTTTNKNLKFAAKTSGNVTYDIAIMGLD